MPKTSDAELPDLPRSASLQARRIVWLALILILLPPLLFSSPDYVAWPQFTGLLAIGLLHLAGSRETGLRLPGIGRPVLAAILIAELAAAIGSWKNGGPALEFLAAFPRFLAIFALALVTAAFLQPPWQTRIKNILLGILITILATSLIGYFFPVERFLAMGESLIYYDPIRLTILWPTRIAMAWAGQIAWEHANLAGFLFTIALALTLDAAARSKSRKSPLLWLLATALATAIFLTGSRSAFVMTAAALPFLLFRRPPLFIFKTLALIAAAIALGCGSVRLKESKPHAGAGNSSETTTFTAAPSPPELRLHTSGIIERGSAGRLHGYRVLWNDELQSSRLFGKGLPATGKPLAQLMHEHSSYLATLRGGGLVALAAHLFLIALSTLAALRLFYRQNQRWPLILLATVLSGLLFDHSSVFRITGRYDVIAHWIALFTPLILTALPLQNPLLKNP